MDKAIEQANKVINMYRSMSTQFYALHGILCGLTMSSACWHASSSMAMVHMVIAKRLDDIVNDRDIVGPLFYSNN